MSTRDQPISIRELEERLDRVEGPMVPSIAEITETLQEFASRIAEIEDVQAEHFALIREGESSKARPQMRCACGRPNAAGPGHIPGCPMEVSAETIAFLRRKLANQERILDATRAARDMWQKKYGEANGVLESIKRAAENQAIGDTGWFKGWLSCSWTISEIERFRNGRENL